MDEDDWVDWGDRPTVNTNDYDPTPDYSSLDEDYFDSPCSNCKIDMEVDRLKLKLKTNPCDYDGHLKLIKLLREKGYKISELRSARECMSRHFPLTEGLWLEWLKDEISQAKEDAPTDGVYELFERAIKDYICPEIWLEYTQFSIRDLGPIGADRIRSIMERALTAVGLHMTKGAAIWEAYREFENMLLATMKQPPGWIPTPEEQRTTRVQLERIHALYRRELAVPLIDMESAFLEYENWTEEPIPGPVLQSYIKAVQQLQKYKPYEEALLIAKTPKLAEYQAYIDFEVKIGDPTRIQLIYERALVENCLVPDLWVPYVQYLDRKLKVKEVVLSTCKRAVRNCPWAVKLWSQYLLSMERHNVEHQIISETFEEALKAGFIQAADYLEIWQAYLDYLRRRVDFALVLSRELEELRSAFARANKYLNEDVERKFVDKGDPSCVLLRTWARVEAVYCRNMRKTRELWDIIMVSGNAKYGNMWLEYHNLERAHGDPYYSKRALFRAVQCTQDYPEHVCEVLLTTMRIEGTLEDWDLAVEKTDKRLARLKEQRAKEAEKEAALAKQEEEKKEEQRKQSREKKKAVKQSKKPKAGVKRKADNDGKWEEEEAELAVKRPKGGSGVMSMEVEDEAMALFAETFDFQQEGEGAAASKWKDTPKVFHDSEKEGFTVFVSNLPYSMAEPEAKLRDLFASCGEVAEVRPIFSNKGAFRGYCYVEFKEKRSALQAFGLDRRVVEGRPMFVSPYVDKSKNPDFKVFKYSTALEKHKLFISGLPFSCTKKELEQVCKAHGNVKDIRLVTNRAGKPKGLAYVEFETETQASQAVLKMDGLAIMDHIIKVAISDPPARRVPEGPEAVGKPSQSQDFQPASGARRKGRTQLSMVPRALQRPSKPAAKETNSMVENPPTTPSPSAEKPKMMSNADFVKLLQKK
ncbi:squamous cell carcinoma antigen recognized by T-cells 3 isoform X1 [Crotalus tigris]|uniref:squamous cell carcinoma antigen recognized by T-cells 3 isoform X1 n=1 Tax=Crotalus tigris TaxID=88082 RepID=UPI00192F1ADB|nr:squamous cell carcinoma antigen recognized by T-cells 3 isoform X1 [Crotalus tigris]